MEHVTKIVASGGTSVLVGQLAQDPTDLKQLLAAKLGQIPCVRSAHLVGFMFKDSPELPHPAIGLEHRGNFPEILAELEPILRDWSAKHQKPVDLFDLAKPGVITQDLKNEPPFFKRSWIRRMLNM